MRLQFKQRLFLYFTIIFSIFTFGIYLFVHSREKETKTEALEERLDIYAETVKEKLASGSDTLQPKTLEYLLSLFPRHVRLTLIKANGTVYCDNFIADLSTLGDHSQRPEIVAAQKKGKGVDIRTSVSNQQKYFYYAIENGNGFVRVAMPYSIETRKFLKPDNGFFYFLLIFFVSVLLLINWVANRFGKSIERLRDFAIHEEYKKQSKNFHFPKDELGEIGDKIADNFRQLKENRNEIDIEREKLLQHVHTSREGICFFTSERKVEFYNGLFIQYINIITDEADSNPSVVFKAKAFHALQKFLQDLPDSYAEFKLKSQGKLFSFRITVFDNNSFEIILNDVTKQEKNLQLKQQMTSNIAHELRTPITGISGYLETILAQSLDEEQRVYFTKQAYRQTKLLAELVQDMSLISKIEEVGHTFEMTDLEVYVLLLRIKEDLSFVLEEKEIDFEINIPQNLKVYGNKDLLYSVFKNLIDNAIRYAGENIRICVDCYKEDNGFYYFSFYDTGIGMKEDRHLPRLFERFYRVQEGRTRETGGSGLGLSIVKNAILIHGGIISAKNRKEGGLEFLFQIKKR